MSETYTFRTAVGGFHKGDVSEYIAMTAAAHQAQVAELKKQLETLEQENQRLLQENEQLKQAAPEEVPPVEAPPQAPTEKQELAAYRRAEAAERLACQRAKKLYAEMQTICDRSATQLDQTDAAAQGAMAAINDQLVTIRDTMTTLYDSVRQSAQALRDMGQLVPDPAEGLEEP
jgi:regulator of replication initiation timing